MSTCHHILNLRYRAPYSDYKRYGAFAPPCCLPNVVADPVKTSYLLNFHELIFIVAVYEPQL